MTSWNYFTEKGSENFCLHTHTIKQGTWKR